MTALSDYSLLARMAHGDAHAFDALFHRHYDRVYGVLFRLVGERAEAEDLAQETFLRLYKRVDRGRPLSMDENIGGWLYRVAMNLGYNALRSRRRMDERNGYMIPGDEAIVEQEADRHEKQIAVRPSLGLPTPLIQ
ncbi:MAG: sigma-70 family RNA polymerase sigma factor [Candidatus Promineofilum sp.]|nr:sigma-70 family RNA polymerase sigma factor [Promineifilum sp.]